MRRSAARTWTPPPKRAPKRKHAPVEPGLWRAAYEWAVLAGIGTFGAVALADSYHSRQWPVYALTGLAGVLSAVITWRHIAHPGLVAYGLCCGTLAAGWEISCRWLFPWSAQAWLTLLAVTLLAPVPGVHLLADHRAWLSDEDRLAAERARQKLLDDWTQVLAKVGYERVRCIDAKENRAGWSLTYELPSDGSVTFRQLQNDAGPKIEASRPGGRRLAHGSVRWESGEDAGEVKMTMVTRDVFAEVAEFPMDDRPLTITKPVDIGLREDGELAWIFLREINVMIFGTTGSGKSNLLNVLIGQLGRCVDAVTWCLDMKHGRLAAGWVLPFLRGEARKPVLDWVAVNRHQSIAMLQATLDVVTWRNASRKGGSKVQPTEDFPALILLCDEIADLLDPDEPKDMRDTDTKSNQVCRWLVKRIGQKCRSAAVAQALATQRATSSFSGGNDVKANCKLRLALGVANIGEAQHVAPGQKTAARQVAAMRHPGTCLAVLGDQAGIPFKMYQLDHVEDPSGRRGCNEQCVHACRIRRHALAIDGIRPDLDPGSAHAAGDAYAGRWEDPVFAAWAEGEQVVATGDEAFDQVVSGAGIADLAMDQVKSRVLDHLAAAGPIGLTIGILETKLKADLRPG